MSVELLAMVAVLPILVALILMVGMRWPATKAMPLAWLVCAVSGILVWGLSPGYVAALTLQGIVTAIGVLIIVFGAILILFTLEKSGGMETIQYGMQNISRRQARSGDHHRIHVCRLHRRRGRFRHPRGARRPTPAGPRFSRHGRGHHLPCVQQLPRELRCGGHSHRHGPLPAQTHP